MPLQCPDCGRFLKTSLVEGLTEGPAPCPGCGAQLTADRFPEQAPPTSDGATPADDAPSPEASVRPPDLPEPDPLEGWDQGAPAPDGGDLVVALTPEQAVAAGLLGGLIGMMLLRRRRALGALLGAVIAILAGGTVRGRGRR